MLLTEIEKKQIIQSILTTISHAADKNYQQRVWINAEGPECEDFDDFVDIILHENGALIEKYKNFGLSKNQYEILSSFQNALLAFSNGKGLKLLPEEFINSSEWNEIVEIAQNVLRAFNYDRK